MTVKQALKWGGEELKQVCERPQYEAELLLAYLLGQDRTYLIMHDDEIIDQTRYETLITRRAKHEPYEYIVGEASFYDIHLDVEEGVLIPRPETEILIDLVAEIIEEYNFTLISEIGVGSGAISVVLARKFSELKIIATDICEAPLRVAQSNVDKYNLQAQVELRESNLIDKVSEPVELVVSNPPYIADDFVLASNVVDYEPKEALFGGKVGDELLKQIILDVKAKGVKWLACEMGYDQKAPIEAFVKDLGVKYIKFYKDLAGIDRGFVIHFT